MASERDLATLLKTLRPALQPDTYVFVKLEDRAVPSGVVPLMQFQEAEGLSLIVTQDDAENHGLEAIYPCRCITLQVHSALEAVGMTAAISKALTDAGISANIVAAYHHDHVFVPVEQADAAIETLLGLSKNAKA